MHSSAPAGEKRNPNNLQGSEKHPTLYWRDRTRAGPTLRIDYVFVPQAAVGLLRGVAIGAYAKWIAAGLSDHAPLTVDFLPEFAAVRPVGQRCSRV